MSVENRVSGNHLSLEDTTSKTIMDLDNGKFLPDKTEHIKQRQNYVDLVSRIIVDNIDCLNFLQQHVVRHIRHKYWKEVAKPTEVVSIRYFSCHSIYKPELIKKKIVGQSMNI